MRIPFPLHQITGNYLEIQILGLFFRYNGLAVRWKFERFSDP